MKLDLVNSFLSWRMKKRYHQIELFMKYPHEVQEEWLFNILDKAKHTEWGRRFDFASIDSYHSFQKQVPLSTYEDLESDILRMRDGAKDVLWPGVIKWFAKSSGTTSSKSKFIPVSTQAIEDCHLKGGKDLLSLYCKNYPDTGMFHGINLRLGGSTFQEKDQPSVYGDVSAIIIENLPFWVELRSTPSNQISLMSEWESKIEAIAETSIKEDVRSMAGVPSWMLVLLHRILEKTGSKNLHEVWPNLELYMHGGVSFAPYRKHFEDIMGRPINYMETYNASEGFFGIQDQRDKQELLLMLDYGIFYEFIPMDAFEGKNSKTIPLTEVELDRNYALVISSNAGLWRYIIGDTVRFTSLNPYRMVISGRTKHFINVFGEEVIIENAEQALDKACQQTGATVIEYTVAPQFMEGNKSGAHEWLIEFDRAPDSLERFRDVLDQALQAINSDYEAKRYKDMALKKLIVHQARPKSFYQWLKEKGRLGGQFKVPRLSNNRKHLDELLALQST